MIHIEFLGNNGSGKTTLWRTINEHIKKVHGHEPSFKKIFQTSIQNHVWFSFMSKTGLPLLKRYSKRLSAGDPRILARFINTHKEYFEIMLTEICSKAESEDHLWRLIFICQAFQFAKEYHHDQYITFDHGFYQTASGLYDTTKTFYKLQNILTTDGPKPDLVFYVQADPSSCLSRIKKRKGGVSELYKNPNLTDSDVLHKLENREKKLSAFANAVVNKVNIIHVLNEGDLDSIKKQIIQHIITQNPSEQI